MANYQYLNETSYQKNNKKVKLAGIIVIVIGICLLCAGIITAVSAARLEVPELGEPGWYESESNKNNTTFLGLFMVMIGIFLTAMGCKIRFGIGNRRQIMAYRTQEVMPITREGVEKMTPTMRTAAREIARGVKEGFSDQETLFCRYCGAQIPADSVFCNKCGKTQS